MVQKQPILGVMLPKLIEDRKIGCVAKFVEDRIF
jgi:hypothetical protein